MRKIKMPGLQKFSNFTLKKQIIRRSTVLSSTYTRGVWHGIVTPVRFANPQVRSSDNVWRRVTKPYPNSDL
ncbi:hypothetical protein DYBT9623_04439 [Dyadobacter sp. CECT 9623]|uniref:Uncharacterized protein n=1 Tax=Dyadobacter linearis TaxID=2823330 RepID=A0ABM8UVY6_9BACT|nr:hypothetical protein [Dyadobacter sp. CECT 9623]CAG5072901.1 hypothetical protein DYBT9623_04439 [Dyadobacter sp. CECT 9623]